MKIEVKKFKNLSVEEIYEILKLRSEVFVVEQGCIYQDIDGKDKKAMHLMGKKDNEIIAYTRIFDSGDYYELPSIARVVVKKKTRDAYKLEFRFPNQPNAELQFVGDAPALTPDEMAEGAFFIILPEAEVTSRKQSIEIEIWSGDQRLAKTNTNFLGPIK